MNIFLVGPMGAGKTTIGKHLAKQLGLQFIDSDHEIEAVTGVKIPVIFEIEGEAGFRKRETAIIDELTQQENIVLATGGGAVINAANRQYLHERGTVIYLQAALEDLLERTRHDKNRPLLQTADPRAKLQSLLEERDPLYREVAHIIIDTGIGNPKKIAGKIIKKLKNQA
ncbi:MAG: shikimate kinase AroK [Gammaproteobacteria bacterium]|nr:shikimate kinase AroK [Gammaproteobacteria bacterium]MDH5654000.1 shikimate kinase AroK [Gammaproteobacteria bacterium]